MFSDIRRFGEIRNLNSFEDYPSFLEIAPEPFDEEALQHFNHYLSQKVANKPIKQMLLDHKIIAGCGNIYACEALFRAGIHPARKVKRYVSSRKTNALLLCTRSVKRGY